MSDLFYLAQCFWGSVILLDVIAEWYSMDWLHHSLFIYSPAEGHLGYLQFLAVMHKKTNKPALNICVQVFKWHIFLFILGKYLELCLLAHDKWYLTLQKKCHSFLNWLYHCAFPEQGNESCSYSATLSALGIVIFKILAIVLSV